MPSGATPVCFELVLFPSEKVVSQIANHHARSKEMSVEDLGREKFHVDGVGAHSSPDKATEIQPASVQQKDALCIDHQVNGEGSKETCVLLSLSVIRRLRGGTRVFLRGGEATFRVSSF